ncbi:hypothetical protein [Thermomicrobium sp.]|jgi:hypothetical protein|uniref:hypothetical protein n=1 Tax=Thermomicrobium sp. TaxID=1969469 RepID=UPI001B2A28AA|nr:hypothetical protein [Thermomicrobium sp.]MBO9305793.1 hypothetical protein [Thermomicrobium sp.]MBO9358186.1 hypothetical protein [Thermomicrobium sp.]MBO9384854.1 hypothetical protein [Thermomicrobium sp.]MBO9404087.1 hypothetical protein [Thermomicrobium sp.]
MQNDLWAWLSLVLLGAFHGANPAMGWLFAVALGLQEQRLAAVLAALLPIALGHAAAIAVIAVLTVFLGETLPQPILLLGAGVVLLGFAGWRLWRRFRHPRTRFRATHRELAVWSFLMATAHGAGLMIAPLLIALTSRGSTPVPDSHLEHGMGLGSSLGVALAATLVHTTAMFATMTVIAIIVYRELGVEILRHAWVNIDLIWIVVLVATGLLTAALGLRAIV